MSAHTRGPWFTYKDGFACTYPENRFAEIEIRNGDQVIIASSRKRDMSPSEHAANASLIAAATDLLGCLTMGTEVNTPDMLEWIADRLVSVHGESPFVDFVVSLRNRANAMRKAIAKAKGESA